MNNDEGFRIFEEILNAMKRRGYGVVNYRNKKTSLRSPSSSDEVDHIITLGYRSGRLGVEYGVFNSVAEDFSIKCLLEDAEFQHDGVTASFLDYCLLKVPAMDQRRLPWKIDVFAERVQVCIEEIEGLITQNIAPKLSTVKTAQEHFVFLCDDDKFFPWTKMNGAVRGAQLAMLGNNILIASDYIKSVLSSQKNAISHSLPKRVDAANYIDRIITKSLCFRPN